MFKLDIQKHGGFIDAIFGGGGDDYTPSVTKVAASPTTVAGSDTSGESGQSSTSKQRKKKGFTSTISKPTLASSSGDSGRSTLG